MFVIWTQFRLLLWKNYLIQIRNPCVTLLELLIVLVCSYLILNELDVKDVAHHPRVIFDLFKASDLYKNRTTPGELKLLYAPANSEFTKIIHHIQTNFPISGQSFLTETELLEYVKNTKPKDAKIFAAVVYTNTDKSTELPNKSKFDIRFPSEFHKPVNNRTRKNIFNWKTDNIFSPFRWNGPLYLSSDLCGQPEYYKEGFLRLAELLIEGWLNHFNKKYGNGSRINLKPFFQRMPYPAHKEESGFLKNAKDSVAFYIVFSMVMPVSYLIFDMTNEKTRGLDKLLKLCNVSVLLQQIAWFLKASINFYIIFLIYLFVLTKYSWGNNEATYINLTDPLIVASFFYIYMLACITYCFLICACFINAYSAYLVGGVVFAFTYLPYYMYSDEMYEYKMSTKIFLLLCPNTAFAYGMECIFLEESNGKGITYAMTEGGSDIKLGTVAVFLLLDAALFVILAFIIASLIRFFEKRSFIKTNVVGSSNQTTIHNVEANPNHIIIASVAMIRKPPILKNVTFNIHKDEVTILFGRSGSGKTTLVDIIANLKRPSSGQVKFKTQNKTNLINLCPEENIYYTDLTVWEHLYFFTHIRGHGKHAYDDVGVLLKYFYLEDYQHVKPISLSRTSLRKMCIAIAFCGNTELIILDQPFIGIDSISKRSISELILKRKKRCGILLATNYMNQVNLLDGRVAILHAGEIKCSGSSDNLRQEYNIGHKLIVFKFNLCCNTDVVTGIIRHYIPKAELADDFNLKLIYVLPRNSVAMIPTLLKELETQRKQCFIETFSIQICSIVDVFNRVTNAKADHAGEAKDARKVEAIIKSTFYLQLMAMHYKFMYRLSHNIFLFCMKIILPIALLFLFLFDKIIEIHALPRLPLTLESHLNPMVFIINDKPGFDGFKHDIFKNNYPIAYITHSNAMHFTYEHYFMDMIEYNPIQMARTLMFGMQFGQVGKNILFFNHLHYHTPGVILVLYGNIIASTYNLPINIEISNYPLPYAPSSIVQLMDTESKSGYDLSKGILLGLAVVTILFLIPHVNEKRFRFKHLQRASGVNLWIFWGYSFAHDFIVYLIIVVLSLLVILFVYNASLVGSLFLIYLAFGVAMVPMISVLSLIPCKIYGILFGFAILTGVFRFLSVDNFFSTLLSIFSPFYNVAASVNNLYGEYDRMKRCNKFVDDCSDGTSDARVSCWETMCNSTRACCKQEGVYLTWDDPGYLQYVVILLVQGLVFTAILILYEMRIIQMSFSKGNKNIEPKILMHHPTVQQEILRVHANEDMSNHPIMLIDLRKVFWSNDVAVDTVCLAVGQSECFALLGTNGAGKTTIFKIITKDLYKSGGRVFILAKSIDGNIGFIRKHIGYCPQSSALLRDLTFKQTLVVFLMLRGYNLKLCQTKCKELANRFGMATKLDIQVKHLSRGERRVLNCCIAILGNSPVILLDEPTSGMDGVMRRSLFFNLYRLRLNGSSILFSCTSMDDCLAISSRFAHMSEGNFLWLGSPLSLKEQFKQRFELLIKLARVPFSPNYSITDMQEQQRNVVIDYVNYHFYGAILKQSANEVLVFHIEKNPRMPWSTIFSIVEAGKSELQIKEYLIGDIYHDLNEGFRLL